jgi:phytanoyl-CoA hydroxylase
MEQRLSGQIKPPLTMPSQIFEFPPGIGIEENYPNPEDRFAFKDWFEQQGYIVIRRAVSTSLCNTSVEAFRREVLTDRFGLFERHVSGKYERHTLTDTGFMKYPIMNLQDISGKKYPQFKNVGLDLLTQASIQHAIGILFGEPGRVVHTMYFDGNQTTWAHRDGHYIDSKRAGGMIGVWVAAEDIHPESGRFYILPGSHRQKVPGEEGDPNSSGYKARMADFVCNGPLPCVAPILQCGDVLLWTALTIHGSLPTHAPEYSRRSFTAHYVPQSHQFQWNVRDKNSKQKILINGAEVVQHLDSDSFFKRLRNTIRSDLPRIYGVMQKLKKHVV